MCKFRLRHPKVVCSSLSPNPYSYKQLLKIYKYMYVLIEKLNRLKYFLGKAAK